jgi:uncharacterized protein YjiS (DUF1127 family)
MTKFPLRIVMRFQEWFEVHLIRWRPAHLELEDDTDEQLKDIGLEPLKRNFTAARSAVAARCLASASASATSMF